MHGLSGRIKTNYSIVDVFLVETREKETAERFCIIHPKLEIKVNEECKNKGYLYTLLSIIHNTPI